ncbi:hypothetical protein NIES267_54950 [Calothrix parasitica NIES-267]|uniref:Uncharacterized protein n=1 Tax=Calothrix parasitica NIES-267 TaxID=1973488 RepID=A0A1Z4LXP4_9CYAN|nr:hypothetical protein NIES267_54950 [Calothrix parasitica NIES-267]
MPKRFNNLDAALKYLRKTGTGDTGDAPDAPAGSQLEQYQKFKGGKIAVTYTRDNGSKPGSFDELIVKPFALGGDADDNALVGVSKRAKDAISNTGLALTDLNATEPSGTATAQKIFGFQPAKAIVTISQTATSNTTSQITGRPYKKRSSDSYTLPFGRKTSTDNYSEVKKAILAKVITGDNNRGVSFDSEVYR